MTNITELFKQVGKSKESIIQTDLDSIRSTLFGKFYEGIIARWLEEMEGFKLHKGRANVYWNETKELKSKDDFSKKLNQALDKKIKDKRKRTNSDGLFEKNGNFYLWEAKNWPKWRGKEKTLDEQVKNEAFGPWLLAKQVHIKGEKRKISGMLFSWWQRFEEYKKLENEVKETIGMPFKFYFTAEIVDDCRKKKYDWYIKLVNEQKQNTDEFFKEILGDK